MPTDDEFVAIFSNMRRRPNGRRLGIVHDIVWQSACLELGLRPYSKAEFEAVFRQLTSSTRLLRTNVSSRNYAESLADLFSDYTDSEMSRALEAPVAPAPVE